MCFLFSNTKPVVTPGLVKRDLFHQSESADTDWQTSWHISITNSGGRLMTVIIHSYSQFVQFIPIQTALLLNTEEETGNHVDYTTRTTGSKQKQIAATSHNKVSLYTNIGKYAKSTSTVKTICFAINFKRVLIQQNTNKIVHQWTVANKNKRFNVFRGILI